MDDAVAVLFLIIAFLAVTAVMAALVWAAVQDGRPDAGRLP